MAKPFTMEVKGLDALMSKYKSLPKKLTSEVKGELEDGANEIVKRAKSDAPADQGFLRNSISSFPSGNLQYQVVSAADYSAYVEFGTGLKVNVPADVAEFAAQFKGSGSGGDAKTAIYEWCRRKGIDEKFWWTIYVSIMTKGIAPHPFFFRNFIEVRPKIVARVQNVIKTL